MVIIKRGSDGGDLILNLDRISRHGGQRKIKKAVDVRVGKLLQLYLPGCFNMDLGLRRDTEI